MHIVTPSLYCKRRIIPVRNSWLEQLCGDYIPPAVEENMNMICRVGSDDKYMMLLLCNSLIILVKVQIIRRVI